MTPPLALYIHVPFCAARCHYCDFNTYAGLDNLFAPYALALSEEIRREGRARARPPARTLYVGGGTPTVLPPDLLSMVVDACREAFDVDSDAEFSCEANPGTADLARFAALRQMGANRLSMGIQSFDDAELRWLGRIHTAAEAESAFLAARSAGFANINLDFIFGLPQQSPQTWLRTLAHAIALQPEHLSLYSLTVEAGTPLAAEVRRGRAAAPDDDLAADLYLAACDTLSAAGYTHYEISNWARPTPCCQPGETVTSTPAGQGGDLCGNHQCQHNLVYWRNEPYLGFGAGAHSYDGKRRWWNVRAVPAYIRRIGEGKKATAGGESITQRLAMGETMMLGLRLVQEGVSRERFRARFGAPLEEVFGQELGQLDARNLLEIMPDRVRLAPQARLLGNQVFAQFLPEG